MELSEQQQQEIHAEFAVRKKRQLMVSIPMALAIVAIVVAQERGMSVAFGPPMMALFLMFVVGALAFSVKNWRCPACESYLGKGFGPKFCPKCGVQLV